MKIKVWGTPPPISRSGDGTSPPSRPPLSTPMVGTGVCVRHVCPVVWLLHRTSRRQPADLCRVIGSPTLRPACQNHTGSPGRGGVVWCDALNQLPRQEPAYPARRDELGAGRIGVLKNGSGRGKGNGRDELLRCRMRRDGGRWMDRYTNGRIDVRTNGIAGTDWA